MEVTQLIEKRMQQLNKEYDKALKREKEGRPVAFKKGELKVRLNELEKLLDIFNEDLQRQIEENN